MKKIVSDNFITFDDVLILPKHSKVLPKDVKVATKLTKKISLQIPILSAAMDTVTESKLAISIAREGGIGIIHKNMSVDAQVHEIDRVKRSEHGMILTPKYIYETNTVGQAKATMSDYRISGLPVINKDTKKLVGLLTNRDIKYYVRDSDYVSSHMTKRDKLIVSSENITLSEAKRILQHHRIEKLPLVTKNDELCGLITSKDIDKAIKYPNASKDENNRLLVGAAVGAKPSEFERVTRLAKVGADVISIDSAHGHSENVINMVKMVRQNFPKLNIIAGNIATASAARDLINAGADALKVGIGPGSICTTRVVTGVGVPQISAIMEVCNVAKKFNIPVIADGGIRYSGDIAKAIAAGAKCVMIGNLFAGCEEAPGDQFLKHGRKYKSYRGMGSIAAMQSGSADRYFQYSNLEQEKFVPEGIEAVVPYRGTIAEIVYQLIGGLKSAMGYTGSKTISQFTERAQFIKITSGSLAENHPHDVIVTKEAPNYFNDN